MYFFYKMYGRTSPHANFCDPKIKGSGLKKLAKVETSQTTDRRQTTKKKRSLEKREKKEKTLKISHIFLMIT